ncbi:hypothetical protein SAMN05216403_10513 [Nitrosospira multiformis ATCC 25196]|uniref:Uncharacterized protein n=1 Tax=Nitrosospira multiformis (strain ATCC 25196 / NCIMB 11849 / C 71) TaxID=323848 RepID=A0A1H5TPN6_NITMU|nr:hypothetical protein SAMN05216403_10513 [Nitrosospira multiformis ATCC 25196]
MHNCCRVFHFYLPRGFPFRSNSQLPFHLRQQLPQGDIQHVADVIINSLIIELGHPRLGNNVGHNPSTIPASALRDGSLRTDHGRCRYSKEAIRCVRSFATVFSILPYVSLLDGGVP